jgi:hypothetical protein
MAVAEDPFKKYDQASFLALAAKGKDAWNAWRRDPANEMVRVIFAAIDFSEAPRDQIDFSGFEFGDYADFSRCKWRGAKVRLKPETFEPGRARFVGAAFGRGASFASAAFGERACFSGAAFGGLARFDGVTFGDGARFDGAVFGDFASFRAVFGDWARFDGATFGDSAIFYGAVFGQQSNFVGAAFGDEANLSGAAFGNKAAFTGAAFGIHVSFMEVAFHGFAGFAGPASRTGHLRRAPILVVRAFTTPRNSIGRVILPGSISKAPNLGLLAPASFIGPLEPNCHLYCAQCGRPRKRQETRISSMISISRNAKPNSTSIGVSGSKTLKRDHGRIGQATPGGSLPPFSGAPSWSSMGRLPIMAAVSCDRWGGSS